MKRRCLQGWFALSLALALDGSHAAQESIAVPVPPINPIAVIYPEIGEPYRSVFSKIMEGIADETKERVFHYAVGANVDMGALNAQLKRHDIKVVIVLGRQGMKAAARLDRGIAVMVGAVLSLPDVEKRPLMGISLSPDPALLFAKLSALQPGIKRVFVIYDSRQNEWLVSQAREAAKLHRLELVAREATDLAAAAKLYEAFFASADPRKDAIWLPQDSTTVDENTILPLVLKASWERSVIVFSSNLLHVKKGVLFALYPNNRELGRSLAKSALGVLAEGFRPGITLLRDVETAINLRTASHMGLYFTYPQQLTFDSVFPEAQ